MKTKYYCLIILMLIFLKPAISQKDSIQQYFWVQLGGVSEFNKIIGYDYSINYSLDKRVFSLKYYGATQFRFLQNPLPQTLSSIKNFSFLYGRSFENRHFKMIPSAGISVGSAIWTTGHIIPDENASYFSLWENTSYREERFDYMGLTGDINFIWTPMEQFGISFNVFGNLHRHADYGFVIGFVVGKLK